MSITGHNANAASTSKTGFVAMLRGFSDVGGGGASKISACRLIFSVLVAGLGTLAFAVAPAFAAIPETPETGVATGETATSAVLHGTLNPNAKSEGGSYQFDYAPAETGGCAGNVAPVSPALALGDLGEEVKETVTGLEANREYLFCVEAFSLLAGRAEPGGAAVSFTTLPAPPTLGVERTSSSSPVSSTGATLEAELDANNESTTYTFEYSTTKSGGKLSGTIVKVKDENPLEGGTVQTVTVPRIEGLNPGKTYYYRVVAENAQSKTEVKPVEGAVQSFTTVPTPATEEVKSITATTATFHGKLTPLNGEVPTDYYFDYNVGEEIACTSEHETLPHESAGTGSGAFTVPGTPVTALEPNQKYTVCLLSANEFAAGEFGSEVSPPVYFTTPPAPPTIEGGSEKASGESPYEQTLEAQVNPNNQATTYTFEYSTTESGGALTGTPVKLKGENPLSGYGEQTASVSTGHVLTPGATYYFRVIAENVAHEKEAGTVEHFTAPATKPPAVESETETAGGVPTEGATLEAIVNPNNQETTCQFEYGSEASLTTHNTVPCPAALGNGGAGVGASITVAGLHPETVYYFRVVATNATGPQAGTITEFKTEPAQAPTISEYVTKVQETAVTLNAQINPNAAATTCQFEYGTEAGVYPNKVPCSPQQLGAGTSPVTVSAPLTGLTPDTTYHYRVVASNVLSPAGGTPGADQTFTTNPAPSTAAESCPNAQARAEQPYGQALPDCRAYELVSPLEKSGFSAEAIDSRASVSDGEPGEAASAVAYISKGSFSEPQSARLESRYISRRGADGWSTQNITPPSTATESQPVAFQELLFTPSLSQGVLYGEDVPLVKGEAAGYQNLYVADLASSPVSYQTVTNVSPPGQAPYTTASYENSSVPKVVGASTDLSHVVFQQHANLTANAEGELEHVYEWVAGKLSLVDVPPAGTKFEREDNAGAPGIFNNPAYGDTWHAVSANGQRVFFTAGEARYAGSKELGQLYVRENPEQEQSPEPAGKCTVPTDACTVEVSASQRTTPDLNGPQPAYFRDANATGTRVFFTSRAELTYNANTGSADNTANLYEYNVETGVLSDITPENSEGAAVLGLVTAGENAGEENSYVYFVANGVLASNENANKETAQPGTCKEKEGEALTGEHTCDLYVTHYDNGKWETKFIAALVAADGTSSNPHGDEADWIGFEGGSLGQDKGPGQHTVRVTPDGTTLAFESERSLTGYDNEPLEPGAGAEEHKCTELGGAPNNSDPAVPCREVYVYNAATEKLVCTSCDPSGGRPVGDAELGGQEEEAANGLLHPSVYYLPRNLSESGGRLFFQSPDALVPRDSNNQLDVYEWEQPASPAEAENSCTSSSSTFSASDRGCVFPISDVAGDYESRFMDATPSGNNVFIKTKDQLVPEADADSRANVYDVRVGGGFPVTTSPPSCNNGDSCKPPVSPQPSIFGAGPTETLSAPGNPAPPPPPAVVKPKSKPLTRAQKLAKALKACAKDKQKSKRAKCQKQAKQKYAAKKSAKKATNDRRGN